MMTTLRRLWIQVTADRKRAGVLGACVLCGMLLWARLIVISKLPRQAVADPIDEPTANQTETDANAAPRLRDKAPISVELADSPARDPFIISLMYFPKPTPTAESGAEAGKSGLNAVENDVQAKVRMHAWLQAVATRFRLDAVMTGSPIAVINGRTYRLGQTIPAVDEDQLHFELLEVRDRSVILGYEGFRFELEIEQPRGAG